MGHSGEITNSTATAAPDSLSQSVDFIVRTCLPNASLCSPLYLVFPALASSSPSRRRAVFSNRPLTDCHKFVLGANHVVPHCTLSRRVASCQLASCRAPPCLFPVPFALPVCLPWQPLLSQRFSPWNLIPCDTDNSSGPEIPFLVTGDLSSNPAIRVGDDAKFVFPILPTSSASNSRNRRDPLLSSPGISRSVRRSVDTSADEDEHKPNPPPPALSTQSSVQSITSTALRSNNPGDGANSLALASRRPVSCRPVSRRVVPCRVVLSCVASRHVSRCTVLPRVKVVLCPATPYLLLELEGT